MKIPDVIEEMMLAPCGMKCAACYKHVGIKKRAKPCEPLVFLRFCRGIEIDGCAAGLTNFFYACRM